MISAEERRRAAVSLAGLLFAVVAPLTYLAQRMYERFRSAAIDPGLILASTHTSFYWRSAIAVWFAATCAAIAYRGWRADLAEKRGEMLARTIAAALAAGAVVFFVAAWLLP